MLVDTVQSSVMNTTPSFFINGRLLSGAHPLESFARVIEEELAR
jgi:protein-disulfide isomerase